MIVLEPRMIPSVVGPTSEGQRKAVIGELMLPGLGISVGAVDRIPRPVKNVGLLPALPKML